MLATLVVDDDFRVAELHTEFVRRVPGLEPMAPAHSLAEARALIRGRRPDLLLLDLYLPDGSGLDLLADVRRSGDLVMQVIIVTAARDVQYVQAAMAGGAAQYIVKPFRRGDLTTRLEVVRDLHEHLARMSEPGQDDIDQAYRMFRAACQPTALRKGISAPTLHLVRNALARHAEGMTAADLAAEADLSRATAQRYLTFLADSGDVELQMRYGVPGRPVHVYTRGEARRSGGATPGPPA